MHLAHRMYFFCVVAIFAHLTIVEAEGYLVNLHFPCDECAGMRGKNQLSRLPLGYVYELCRGTPNTDLHALLEP